MTRGKGADDPDRADATFEAQVKDHTFIVLLIVLAAMVVGAWGLANFKPSDNGAVSPIVGSAGRAVSTAAGAAPWNYRHGIAKPLPPASTVDIAASPTKASLEAIEPSGPGHP